MNCPRTAMRALVLLDERGHVMGILRRRERAGERTALQHVDAAAASREGLGDVRAEEDGPSPVPCRRDGFVQELGRREVQEVDWFVEQQQGRRDVERGYQVRLLP